MIVLIGGFVIRSWDNSFFLNKLLYSLKPFLLIRKGFFIFKDFFIFTKIKDFIINLKWKAYMKKIILITGTTRGMGKRMTEEFCKLGHKVVMIARNPERGEKVYNEFKSKGYDVILKIADMSKKEDLDKISEELLNELPKLDVLINNAAIQTEPPETRIIKGNVSFEEFEKIMRTNVYGPLYLIGKLFSLLEKSEDARIINFSSGLGSLGGPRGDYYPSYSISKVGINMVTRETYDELKEAGLLDRIMVFSVDPGWVKTDLGGSNAPRTIEQGIDTPMWLSLENREKLENGKFYYDRNIIEW